jgi:GH18 family chitinase
LQYQVVPLNPYLHQTHGGQALQKTNYINGHAYKAQDQEKNVVCYFANWASLRRSPGKYVPENINSKPCTHIFYAFAGLDSETFEAVPGDVLVDVNDGTFKLLKLFIKTTYLLTLFSNYSILQPGSVSGQVSKSQC